MKVVSLPNAYIPQQFSNELIIIVLCCTPSASYVYAGTCLHPAPSLYTHKCTIPRVRLAQDNSPAWTEMTRERIQAGKKSNAYFEIISDRPYCAGALSLSLNGHFSTLSYTGRNESQPVCPYLLRLCTNISLNVSHNIAISCGRN